MPNGCPKTAPVQHKAFALRRHEAFAVRRDQAFAPSTALGWVPTEFAWSMANLGVSVVSTAGAIALIQNPVNSLIFHKRIKGCYFPPASLSATLTGSIAAGGHFLYKGLGKQLTAGGVRTVYVLNAKNMTEHNSQEKKSGASIATVAAVASISAGELLVTQGPNARADLEKMGKLSPTFNWRTPNNIKMLLTTGAGAKLSSLAVNYACLIMLEKNIHDAMPIKNEAMNHLASGMVCGMLSAVACFPSNTYRDNALAKLSVDNQGELKAPTISFFKAMKQQVNTKGYPQLRTDFLKLAAQELPLRMFRNSSIFGVICLMSELLGEEPLNKFRGTQEKISYGGNDSLDTPAITPK